MGENFLFILLKLVLLWFALLIVGEPLRLGLSHHFSPFRNLVPLQVALLDVYLGGLIFYAIALIPLRMFSGAVTWCVLLISSGFLIILIGRKIWMARESNRAGYYWKLLRNNKSIILETVIVVSMFLLNLGIQVFSVRGFIFGSIHDSSLHALFTQVILENRQIPATLQPYMTEGIVYPQAPHVIFAYAFYVVGWEPADSVLYVSILFNSMSILAAYYLGKKLWPERHFGVSMAFLFAFVSNWPVYITWGANALIVGLPFFFVLLSLLPIFSRTREEITMKESIIAGVLLGYLATLYLLLYEAVVLSVVLILLFMAFRYLSYVRKKFEHFLMMLGVSIFPMSVFLFRFVEFYIYPGYNPGATSDLPKYQPATPNIIDVMNWPFESQHPLLLAELWLLFFISVAVIAGILLKKRRDSPIKNVTRVALPAFCAIIILTLGTYLPISSIIPLELGIVIALIIPICLTVSVLNIKLCSFTRRKRGKGDVVYSKIRPLATVVALIFLAAYTPFIYYGVWERPTRLANSYDLFAITTHDDYDLMLWMRDNLPRDAVILVNPDEPGSFIPAVSHRMVVFPFTGNRRSPSYQQLVGLIQQKTIDATTFDLMKHFNITHVYVGARSTYWWDRETKWDPQFFLSNTKRFALIQEIGQAYLFRVYY